VSERRLRERRAYDAAAAPSSSAAAAAVEIEGETDGRTETDLTRGGKCRARCSRRSSRSSSAADLVVCAHRSRWTGGLDAGAPGPADWTVTQRPGRGVLPPPPQPRTHAVLYGGPVRSYARRLARLHRYNNNNNITLSYVVLCCAARTRALLLAVPSWYTPAASVGQGYIYERRGHRSAISLVYIIPHLLHYNIIIGLRGRQGRLVTRILGAIAHAAPKIEKQNFLSLCIVHDRRLIIQVKNKCIYIINCKS